MKQTYEEELKTNKLLLAFTMAFVAVTALVFLYRGLSYGNTFNLAYNILKITLGIGILGMITSVFIALKQKGHNTSLKIITGKNVFIISSIITISMLLLKYIDYNNSIKVLYVAIPLLAVFYLIFVVYVREFFIIAGTLSFSVISLWYMAKVSENIERVGIVATISTILILIGLLTILIAKRKDGIINIANKEFRILPKDLAYKPVSIVLAVMILIILLAKITTITYLLMYLCVALLFVFAVYYTVKMM